MARSVIISNKHDTCELPHEPPNVLRRWEKSGKSQYSIELQPSARPSLQTQKFFDTSRKLLKNRNSNFPVLRYFTLKLEFVSYILSAALSLTIINKITSLRMLNQSKCDLFFGWD